MDKFLEHIYIKRTTNITVINIAREEFVKDMSYPKASIGTIVFTSNCDNGLANLTSNHFYLNFELIYINYKNQQLLLIPKILIKI